MLTAYRQHAAERAAPDESAAGIERDDEDALATRTACRHAPWPRVEIDGAEIATHQH